jgi:hypothetical protein
MLKDSRGVVTRPALKPEEIILIVGFRIVICLVIGTWVRSFQRSPNGVCRVELLKKHFPSMDFSKIVVV